jgi:hypothetical protein
VTGLAVAAAVGPGLLADQLRSRAAHSLEQLGPPQREVSSLQRSIEVVDDALERAAVFAESRSGMTNLLASLTEYAPEMTALLNIRIDSLGGSLTALSPHGAELFAAVSQIPEVAGTQISAPLIRETINGLEFERVALRFQVSWKLVRGNGGLP